MKALETECGGSGTRETGTVHSEAPFSTCPMA
jgi:hypothetical protein